MKTIYEAPIGGDGAKAGAYIDGELLSVQVSIPLAVVSAPIGKLIDSAIDKVEAAIPGDWDKALLEPIRAAAKAELITLLGG